MGIQMPLSTCIDSPITPQLWQNLGLDSYLQNYPSGNNLTLSEYARHVHAANFFCGIGRQCLAGQPCFPVKKLDWLILYSVQQWNFFMNSLYQAVSVSINIVREVAAEAINDFTSTNVVRWMGLTITVGVLAAIVLTTASALMAVGFLAPEIALASEALGEGAVAGGAAEVTTASAPKLVRRHHKETLSTDKFAAYASLSNDLAIVESKLSRMIHLNMTSVLQSPISSNLGIFNIIRNGTYLSRNPTTTVLQEEARKVAQLTMISELFRSLGMFIIIDTNPCDDATGDQNLIFCNQGLTMKIVRVEDDAINEKIPNAELLSTKYGYSAQYLITNAWRCQLKYGNDNSTSHNNPDFTWIESDCAFSLPVCDTRQSEIHKQIENNVGYLSACRDAGNLPI